jgi:hypothetical protein
VSTPRLLDLFCGAGGAGMGYHRAGFEVVGVDIAPQPHFPFEFHQADALDVLRTWNLGSFDALHASPPCQHYANVTRWRGRADDHPDLIAPTRHLLVASGLPWVMENVRTVELEANLMLCGSQFGLPIRRHRYFQLSWAPFQLHQPCRHRSSDFSFDHGGKQPESIYRYAMGVEWMTVHESREAIPPAYTAWIGTGLLDQLAAVEGGTP